MIPYKLNYCFTILAARFLNQLIVVTSFFIFKHAKLE